MLGRQTGTTVSWSHTQMQIILVVSIITTTFLTAGIQLTQVESRNVNSGHTEQEAHVRA